jgi:hypothetical protein
MKRRVLGFGILVFLASAAVGMAVKPIEQKKESALATKSGASENRSTSDREASKPDMPAIIKSPSTAGEVAFPHQKHYQDLGLECKTCHHETNAAALKSPHAEYFDDFWIDCKICHRENGSATLESQSCSKCHHALPANIADETLSSKVVIHKQCWKCHDVGQGADAGKNCKLCHSGPRTKF